MSLMKSWPPWNLNLWKLASIIGYLLAIISPLPEKDVSRLEHSLSLYAFNHTNPIITLGHLFCKCLCYHRPRSPPNYLNIFVITLCICYNGKHLDKQACSSFTVIYLFFYISREINQLSILLLVGRNPLWNFVFLSSL